MAQYNCRLLRLHIPGVAEPALAGMGLNMAVDPAYRGRGLLETVAGPVHSMITERGCVAGVGFSSTGGLEVTRKSSTYRYEVLGPMASSLFVVTRRQYPEPLALSETWPEGRLELPADDGSMVRYAATPASLHHRFAEHPFRRYRFGAWREDDAIRGLVVYRKVRLRGVPGIALSRRTVRTCPRCSRAGPVRSANGVADRPRRDVARITPARARCGRPSDDPPWSRSPYHLIARALRDDTPSALFELDRWDCAGGDIL